MYTTSNIKMKNNSKTKSGKEYFNPYSRPVKENIPLVTVPKTKKLVSKKRLAITNTIITILLASIVLLLVQLFAMDKMSTDFYKKNNLLQNQNAISRNLELVSISGDTLTFTNGENTFVTQLPMESYSHLKEGETYKVSYNKGGLIYIGTIDK